MRLLRCPAMAIALSQELFVQSRNHLYPTRLVSDVFSVRCEHEYGSAERILLHYVTDYMNNSFFADSHVRCTGSQKNTCIGEVESHMLAAVWKILNRAVSSVVMGISISIPPALTVISSFRSIPTEIRCFDAPGISSSTNSEAQNISQCSDSPFWHGSFFHGSMNAELQAGCCASD